MTRSSLRACAALVLAATLGACASAGDRFKEGMELEAQGRHYEAAFRYADAVDKDPSMVRARERLLVVGDSALLLGMESAAAYGRQGHRVRAAQEFLALDRLLSRAAQVGVRLDPPDSYGQERRSAFDDAIAAHMEDGTRHEHVGRWNDARQAYVRARTVFEPSAEQRAEALRAERNVLLAWADDDLAAGRYRAAYLRAEDAVSLEGPLDPDVQEAAAAVQERALAHGTVGLAVLPVSSTAPVLDLVGEGFGRQLSDVLELDYWRTPPPFVAVADPVMVRHEARRAGFRDEPLRPREVDRVLHAVGADFGALIEMAALDRTEEDVVQRRREARTRRGRPTSYVLEEGRLRYRAHAHVVIVDGRGREVSEFTTSATATGEFERAVYAGDPGDLELSRNELRWFDRTLLEEELRAMEDEVVFALADRVAPEVLERVLRRVP